jgi:5-methylcytosine-specific restriction endonuclease McrA
MDRDEPVCATPECFGSPARWKTRHGTWAYHPYCSFCLKAYGRQGGRGNRRIPKRIRLTEIDACFYCGLPDTEEDHIIPLSALGRLPLQLHRELVVPSCTECNRILGDFFTLSLIERKEELRRRLRKRYKTLLRHPDWDQEDLDELSGSLKKHVIGCQLQKKQLLERLAYEAPANHFVLLRAEYAQYQQWLDQLGARI